MANIRDLAPSGTFCGQLDKSKSLSTQPLYALPQSYYKASESLCQAPRCGGLRVLIRLWKTYRLFPQVLWKTIRNCETLCCSNCVVPETYVGGLLTFMRSCDSLPAKITRSQRLFYKPSEGPQREHKRESFHTSLIFLAFF